MKLLSILFVFLAFGVASANDVFISGCNTECLRSLIDTTLPYIIDCENDSCWELDNIGEPNNCVPQQEIIKTLESLLSKAEPNNSGIIYIVSGCEFPSTQAARYECLANKARMEEQYFKDMHDLLERAKTNGICAQKGD